MYLQGQTDIAEMSFSLGSRCGLKRMTEPLMPGLLESLPSAHLRSRLSWVAHFPQPRDHSCKPGGFLTLKVIYLNLASRLPLLFFLASLADAFSAARPCAGFSTDVKVHSEVTVVAEGCQPVLPPSHSNSVSCPLLWKMCHLGSGPCRISASATFSHKVTAWSSRPLIAE